MAALYKHGEETERWRWERIRRTYSFRNNGTVLRKDDGMGWKMSKHSTAVMLAAVAKHPEQWERIA